MIASLKTFFNSKANRALTVWLIAFVLSITLLRDVDYLPEIILALSIFAIGWSWKRHNAQRERLTAQHERLTAQHERLTATQAQLEALTRTVSENTRHIRSIGQRQYESFNRSLRPEHLDALTGDWLPVLQLTRFNKMHLQYMAFHIVQIEDQCLGRIAGDVEDGVLRVLVALAVQDDDLSLLEIGTLFGINAVATYNLTFAHFKHVTITLIDPLDGYYQQGNDTKTGLPVDERLVRHNLARNLIPEQDYRIIKRYSSESTAIEEASTQTYNCAFIDGDHSFEGISQDVTLYNPMIRGGGFIIIDNYGDPEWDGVTRFVDSVMMTHPEYHFLGRFGRTVIFQKQSQG